MSPTSYQTAPPRVICILMLNYQGESVNIKRISSHKGEEEEENEERISFLALFDTGTAAHRVSF